MTNGNATSAAISSSIYGNWVHHRGTVFCVEHPQSQTCSHRKAETAKSTEVLIVSHTATHISEGAPTRVRDDGFVHVHSHANPLTLC